MKQLRTAVRFYAIRLPAVFVLAPLGLVFGFVMTFPWKLAVALDSKQPRPRKKNNRT